jgi:Tol biopolymer transport system component
MKRRTLSTVLALLLTLLGLTAWLLSPKIAALQPQEGPLHGQQPLQITFSRPMRPESVRAHLILQPELDSQLRWDQDGKQLTIQPQEHWPQGAEVTVGIQAGALSRISLPVLSTWRSELSVSPALLAYLWPADGPSGLYLLNPATGESRRLVSHPEEILDFTLSPDGLTVYFSSFSGGGDSVIYRHDRLSGSTQPVIKCGTGVCQNPSLAENGRDLLYEYSSQGPGAKPGVYLYSLGEHNPEPLGPPEDHLTDPAWGPEGWLSVYNRTQQHYHLINTRTNQEVTLPNQTGGPGTWTNLGPAFVTTEIYNLSDTLAPRHLLHFNPVEETLSDLTQDNFLEDANPVYSPSGSRLAFGRKSLEPSTWSPGRQLWIREETTGSTFQLTEAVDYNHTAFAWDPEENRLAYVRYNQAELAEPPEIWLIDLVTGENNRLLINGFAPRWIP